MSDGMQHENRFKLETWGGPLAIIGQGDGLVKLYGDAGLMEALTGCAPQRDGTRSAACHFAPPRSRGGGGTGRRTAVRGVRR